MSGAIIDLVAKGVQDAYLTGQPEVSFFHQNYRRHTNFAMTNARLNPMGGGRDHVLKIPNKGDLLSYVWVDLGSETLASNAVSADTNPNPPAVFELWIGGKMIDRQDAFYMVQMWNKFLVDSGAKSMACQARVGDEFGINAFLDSNWLPLHFFFCDSYYLPLLALQYNEVEIRIRYSSEEGVPNFKYYANYIVLDTDERKAFVDKDLDILVEQVQKITAISDTKFDLGLLNHPVKCLLWGKGGSASSFTTDDVQIHLNGTELFESALPDKFFTQVQGYYHSEYASELLKNSSTGKGGDNLKMYSFALKANRHQPSGACNFSRLDNASLTFGSVTNPPTQLNLYAVNYNILRIKQGMAGLAFSN